MAACEVFTMKSKGQEIRFRLPRIIMNLVMVLIFWIIAAFIPPTLRDIIIPGINVNAEFLVWILATLVMAIFLIRALSDALVLGDILTDVIVRKLGVKEERSPKRAARDFVYIIIVILVVTAASPLLATVSNLLSMALTYIGLALIILFIYDIGRILYKLVEEKAESFSDRLVQTEKENRQQ